MILGPAMENHTLMHHTLGTGEFGLVARTDGSKLL